MLKKRQYRVNLILIAMMIVALIIQFQSAYDELIRNIQAEADYVTYDLSNQILEPIEQLDLLSLEMERFLMSTPEDSMPSLIENGKSYYVMPEGMPFESSLTGIAENSTTYDEIKDELNAALWLNPSFHKVIDNTPEIKWVYYTSVHQFLNIYPYVSYDDYRVTEDTFNYDFFQLVNPEHNPSRGQKWTKLYDDQVTGEKMITISLPVYVGDTFYGALSVDYTLESLSKVLAREDTTLINYVIFNDFGETVATHFHSYNAEQLSLNTTDLRNLVDHDGFSSVGQFLIKSNRIGGQPIFIASIVDTAELQFNTIRQIFPLMIFIIAMIIIVNLYYRAMTINAQLENSERQFKTLYNQSPQLVIMMNTMGDILDINRYALNFMRVKRESVLKLKIWELPFWTDHSAAETDFTKHRNYIRENGYYQSEYKLLHHRGDLREIIYMLVPMNDANDKLEKIVMLGMDVTEQKDLQYQLENMLKMDHLTQALNRHGLFDVLDQNISRLERHGDRFTLLLCDIDFFKQVNDTFGHECGDEILKNLVKTMTKQLRPYDHIGRWGGEEFLIILEHTDEASGFEIADRLRAYIGEQPFRCSGIGNPLYINITIGVKMYDLKFDLNKNIALADQALYYGKRNGRNQTVLYERIEKDLK